MTNKEFIRRLRLAKVEALRLWPDYFCIFKAIRGVFGVNSWGEIGSFGDGTIWDNDSSGWTSYHAKSPADIARVFDESIKNLGGKP